MGQRRWGEEWIIDLKRHNLGPKQGYYEKKGTGSEQLNFGKYISLYKSWQGLRIWEKRKNRIKTLLPFTYICWNIGSPDFRPIISPLNINRNLDLSEICWQNTTGGRKIGGKLDANFSHSLSVAVPVTLKKMFLDLSCGNIFKTLCLNLSSTRYSPGCSQSSAHQFIEKPLLPVWGGHCSFPASLFNYRRFLVTFYKESY